MAEKREIEQQSQQLSLSKGSDPGTLVANSPRFLGSRSSQVDLHGGAMRVACQVPKVVKTGVVGDGLSLSLSPHPLSLSQVA